MSLGADVDVLPRKCPFSLKQTEDTTPFDLYAQLRERGEVLWDDGMNGWVVTSFEACRFVFKNDKVLFRHPDGDADGDYAAMSPGLRPLKTLVGEQHRKLHNWLMMAFSPTETAAMQDGLVREVIATTLDDLEGRQAIDLVNDFVDRIPVRVIAAVLDLPWRDQDWLERAQGHLKILGSFFNRRLAMTRDVSDAAARATAELKQQLLPILQERSDGSGTDLISKLWRDGPAILDNWSIDDTFVNVNTVFLGGYDTSTLAISNAFYFLLMDHGLLERVRDGSPEAQQRYVEEVLRLLPPIHYRARRANADVEIAGVRIRKDDFVIPLMGSANRDEDHYACPVDIAWDRKNPRDHLTFISGPRSCIGAGLARIEIREAIRLFLERYPDVRLDPEREEPSYIGLTTRRFEPMHVRLHA